MERSVSGTIFEETRRIPRVLNKASHHSVIIVNEMSKQILNAMLHIPFLNEHSKSTEAEVHAVSSLLSEEGEHEE